VTGAGAAELAAKASASARRHQRRLIVEQLEQLCRRF
jgi:hypothetical protein